MSLPTDDAGEALIESHFVYKDEWDLSYLLQCEAGHIRLCQSRVNKEIPPGQYFGTCSRSDFGGPTCGKKMSLYTPDDEGLTTLQWAKKLLQRDSKRHEDLCIDNMRLESAVKDLVALFRGQPEKIDGVFQTLDKILKRPVVKRALER